MKLLGEMIREARIEHNWSLDDLHQKTKIRFEILESIENGTIRDLPEPYYRAFVRTLANTLGLNARTLLKSYDERNARSGEVSTATANRSSEFHPVKLWQKYRKQMIVGLGSIVFILIGLIYVLNGRKLFYEPADPSAGLKEDSRYTTQHDTLSGSFLLRAVGLKQGWLGVQIDSGYTQNVCLEKGQKHEWWVNHSVILDLEEGRDILLYLNGVPMEWTPEDSGKGMELVITADGLFSQSVKKEKIVPPAAPTPDSVAVPLLLGLIEEKHLFERCPVFSENRDKYQPNSVILSRIESINPNVRIICFLGTWDPLSQEVVPKLLRILQLSYMPDVTVNLIGLNRELQDRAGLAEYHKVQGIPTILFYFRGHELGRVVGRPTSRIENRFLEMAQRTEKIIKNDEKAEIDTLHEDVRNGERFHRF